MSRPKRIIPTTEIARLVDKHWLILPKGISLTLVVATFLGESDGNANALNITPRTGDRSYGIASINLHGDMMEERLRKYNLKSPDDLYDPETNIRVSFLVWVEAEQFHPGTGFVGTWGAYRDGGYKKHGRLEKATAAVKEIGGGRKRMTYAIQRKVQWRGPVPNQSGGLRRPVRGVVLHIMAGTLAGTDSWFKQSRSKASSHYGINKGKTIYQWVDWQKGVKAWTQGSGNPYWVSIEIEGQTGDKLNADMLESVAQIVAHVFTVEGVPFVKTDDINGRGLGWHGMGKSAWGGHTQCPGAPIVAQRDAILKRAKELAGGAVEEPKKEEEEDEMIFVRKTNTKEVFAVVGGSLLHIQTGAFMEQLTGRKDWQKLVHLCDARHPIWRLPQL